MSEKLIAQTRNAMDFVQKLYHEVSYLIKEIEGLLSQEEEEFIIGRPSGYSVTSRTSSGLEPMNVDLWMPKAFTVFFCPKAFTETKKGQTITPFKDDLKLLLLDIDLGSKKNIPPRVAAGCLYDIKNKREKDQEKFEHLMWRFTYDREKVFARLPSLDWADSYVAFKGEFIIEPLFNINDSDTVVSKIIEPMLEKYRSV
jgi:hypothetical protein